MDNAIVIEPRTIPKARLWTALAAILLGQFVVAIDLTVLNIALPEITRELNPASDQLLWIVDVYSLVLAGLLIATSSLSDRLGRKKTLLTGFLIFGIGSVLVMPVDAPEQIIAIRAFLGIGGAMIMPVTISMIRSIFTNPKERTVAVAAWSAVSAIGMAAGPLIGGFLLEHFSWHSAFLVNVPLVGAAFVLGAFTLPEVRLKNPGRFDLPGSVLALAGMVALLWGVKHLAAELALDTAGAAALAAGIVLLALFALRCLKSSNPLVDLSLFKSTAFSAGVMATMACTFALAVLLYMLAQWLQLVNGDGTLESGMHLIPMSVATLVSSLGAASLAMRFPARHVVAAGLAIAAAAMIMLFFFRDDLSLAPVIASTCLVGLGTGSLAIGASLIMAETPVEKASSAGSLQEISYDLGNVLGVAILGSLASVIYRSELSVEALRAMGLDGQTIDAAQQSFAATAEIATGYGLPELLGHGIDAFNDSLVITCLIGGIIILAAAVAVWKLVPARLKVTESEGAEPAEAPHPSSSPKSAEPAT
ncbi:MFS transporter [Gordonibacter sp. An230]|uniref:MFS transporter n=1 Tax=Gordonibacter sp. An230 TaxID=1965592 RepID=UPI0013A66B15|nr:MFS transporter [Gordonibacter sp. An230]